MPRPSPAIIGLVLSGALLLAGCQDDEPKIAPGGTGTTPGDTVPGNSTPGAVGTRTGSPGSIPPGTGTPSPPDTPTPTPDSTRPGTSTR
jgi:hypothetical protein